MDHSSGWKKICESQREALRIEPDTKHHRLVQASSDGTANSPGIKLLEKGF